MISGGTFLFRRLRRWVFSGKGFVKRACGEKGTEIFLNAVTPL